MPDILAAACGGGKANLDAGAQVADLVGAAGGDEDGLARVLLEVPRLHPLLRLQRRPVLRRQHEALREAEWPLMGGTSS